MKRDSQIVLVQSLSGNKEMHILISDNYEVDKEISEGREWIKASEKELDALFEIYLHRKFKRMITEDELTKDMCMNFGEYDIEGQKESKFTVKLNCLGTYLIMVEIEKDKIKYEESIMECDGIPF